MSRLPAAMMGLCVALFARPASCDDKPAPVDSHDRKHLTSPYPSRWCIEHLIEATRANRRARVADQQRVLLPLGPDSVPVDLVFADPGVPLQGTLIGRVIEQRSLRIATLWTGRRTVLYFGLDDHGFLGVSLGERQDTPRR